MNAKAKSPPPRRSRAPREGSPPRVRRTPEEARAVILEAALRLLAERGPDATGLKDVARAAGVSHALVSHYYGTYDALVEAALAAHVARVRAELLARLAEARDGGPTAWIDHLFDSIGHPLYGRLLAWSLLSGRVQREDFFPRREQGLRHVADALEARLAAAGPAPRAQRDELEYMLVLALSAAFGYAMGGAVLWAGLGREPSTARDHKVRARLAAIVAAELAGR